MKDEVQFTPKQNIYFVLSGFFIANALLAELTGGKLFAVGPFQFAEVSFPLVALSIGVISWPVVFIMTDLINEYFGKKGVRRLTFLTMALIAFAFLVLYLAIQVPAWKHSPVSGEDFSSVFGTSSGIIIGSLTAFAVSQLVDVYVFSLFKERTGAKLLWLRATGSTVVSQVVDTFLVGFIAFVIPGKLSFADFILLSIGNYTYKLLIAIAVTPLIYLIHAVIDRYIAGKMSVEHNS